MKYLTTVTEVEGMVRLELLRRDNVGVWEPSALVAYATGDEETIVELLKVLTKLVAPHRRAKKQAAKASGNVVVGRFGKPTNKDRANG